jgi:25S rRNA (adenine2142-N1)-methyltransferase
VAAAHAAAARGGKGQRTKAHAALIAGFHALNKRLAAARLRGDDKTASELEAEIAALGGLERYQEASVRGEKLKGGTTNTAQWLVRAAHMHACMHARPSQSDRALPCMS